MARRAAGRAQPVLQVGDLRIDPAARTVTRAGEPVELSSREFGVLLSIKPTGGSGSNSAVSVENVRPAMVMVPLSFTCPY